MVFLKTDERQHVFKKAEILTEATAKLKASIGFQATALAARPRVTFESGEEVRKSYRIIDLSVAQEASTLVSVWFQLRAVIVSVELGQCSVCKGVEEERERS